MPVERTSRVTLIVTPGEQQEIRMAAAKRGVSLSEFGRVAALALARGQVIPNPRLPGIDAEEALPDWLTRTG